ncbi:MAG TPA: YafY family protein [Acidimicrobiales bacterium]|jgi:predicted DNA-binding transcriptional regulator YafY|nr:YafY family protein [Acidimicrobiales bacterium]
MRADRLVAILLMLQTRGRVTASEVATELEVSERTARRDLEALAVAGLPVYSLQGRNGGWRLAGGGRTDLSGLSAAEARALFLVAGPSSSATPELRAALRKLVRALPESFRTQAEAARTAVVVDTDSWGRSALSRPTPPHFETVQQAVIEGERLNLGYVARDGSSTSRSVHPLGLAAKGSAWYLVADTDAGRRTFRVDRITAVERTGLSAPRPEGFDLADAWTAIISEVERMRSPVTVKASVDPDMVGLCRWLLGNRVSIGPAGPDGRVEMEIRGQSHRSLIGELAGLGTGVEVHDPPELRRGLAQIGRDLAALYENPPAPG